MQLGESAKDIVWKIDNDYYNVYTLLIPNFVSYNLLLLPIVVVIIIILIT